ncbi:TPA: hypothetical protein RQK05_004174 [Vibrio vulnificus]|nr:hypothetical protein [Vibrio vulnificus]HDY7749498.1 hypothetical protein [Vibrio vulnificus]HDY7758837.1 hypothetical protein [Vibrio vulnificus]HDY7763493.1 hypothetical protein [Vibrio vulnificus]HDY7772661.1 hypothetical protein [Vibrio vulnificus]
MRINPPIDTKPTRDDRPSTQKSFDVKTIGWPAKAKQKVKAILNFIGLRSKKKASSKLNKVSVATKVNYSSINECNSSEMVRVPSERDSKPRQESMKESSGVEQLQRSSVSATAEHLPSKVLSKQNTIAHLSPESSGRVEKNVHHKVSPDEPAEVQANETKCKANASLENSQVSSSQPLIETSVVSKEANIEGLSLTFMAKQELVERILISGPKTPAEALIKQQEKKRNKKTSPPKTSVPDAPSPTTPQVSLKPGVIPPPPPPPPGLLSGPDKVWKKNVWAPVDVGETPSGNKKNHVVSAKKYIDEHRTKEMDSINDQLRELFESRNKGDTQLL